MKRSLRMICRALPLVVALMAILAATPRAEAICTAYPTVTASWSGADVQGNGTLTAHYSFPDTGDFRNRWMAVLFDGAVQVQEIRPTQETGTLEVPEGLFCQTNGTHTFQVQVASCGGNPLYATADVPVTVDNKPTVSVEYHPTTPGSASGKVTMHYTFQNSVSPADRGIHLAVDGTVIAGYQISGYSGSFDADLSTSCWTPGVHTISATAIACGHYDDPAYQAHGETTVTVNDSSFAKIALKRIDADATSHAGEIQFDLDYQMSDFSNAWALKLYLLSWEDAAGVVHSGSASPIQSNTPALQGGTWEGFFTAPSGARQVNVRAVASSCTSNRAAVAASTLPCCGGGSGGGSPNASNNPVVYEDGNVRFADEDPLPPLLNGISLTRTYDSQQTMSKLFGVGWTTLFEQRLLIDAMSGQETLAHFTTADNGSVIFAQSGSSYVQRWPTDTSAPGTLSYDSQSGLYLYRAPNSRRVQCFRASDGRLVSIRELGSAHSLDVTWDNDGLPIAATDSWTGVAWLFTVDSSTRRVSSIAVSGRSDLVWSYTYDSNGALLSVTPPVGGTWRTYEYGTWGMTAAYDARGNLIESHTFDTAGRAISSTGSQDEISSVQYFLSGATAGDSVTRATWRSGAVVDYVLRPIGGAWHTVHVIGGCTSCGARDSIYFHDKDGHVLREQAANGYVTETVYSGGQISSVRRPLRPSGCDPETSGTRCRLDENTLGTATLDTTSATNITTFTYGDPYWPEKPTEITRTSVLVSGSVSREQFTYDAATGTVLSHRQIGWTGATPQQLTLTTTTALYDGTEGAAFNPGGSFSSGWLSLPQPVGSRKSVDGARTDVTDLTRFVYYPIDATVPATLRGRLAAVQNAAGQVVRYESYDEFGNALRVVEANGVATEMTVDGLGRPLTTTIKAVAGCDTAADALCATDLTTTRVYDPAAGPLQRMTRPNGNVTLYEYDARGRSSAVMRGTSSTDLRERMETTYDLATGKKNLDRYLGRESSAWVVKRSESFQYDTLAQLSAIVHGDATSIGYDYDVDGLTLGMRDENHATHAIRLRPGPAAGDGNADAGRRTERARHDALHVQRARRSAIGHRPERQRDLVLLRRLPPDAAAEQPRDRHDHVHV
jgi:YD repeat-containing protein